MALAVRFFTQIDFDTNATLRRLGLEPGGRVQMAVDNAVMKYCQPFMPFDSGRLSKSVYTATVPGSGEVVWPGPYAHYMWAGEVYGPNIPVFDDDSGVPTRWFSPPNQKKHPTGRDLHYTTDKNPLAGPRWEERMKAAYMDAVLHEAQMALEGG